MAMFLYNDRVCLWDYAVKMVVLVQGIKEGRFWINYSLFCSPHSTSPSQTPLRPPSCSYSCFLFKDTFIVPLTFLKMSQPPIRAVTATPELRASRQSEPPPIQFYESIELMFDASLS